MTYALTQQKHTVTDTYHAPLPKYDQARHLHTRPLNLTGCPASTNSQQQLTTNLHNAQIMSMLPRATFISLGDSPLSDQEERRVFRVLSDHTVGATLASFTFAFSAPLL